MNKIDIDKRAKETFKGFPEAEECFVATDGNVFLSKNAADLNKNTNPGKKKIQYVRVENSEFANSEGSNKKGSDKKGSDQKILSKMTKAELEQTAKGLVDISKAANNADRVKLIEAAQKVAKDNKELLAKLPTMSQADLKTLAEAKGARPEEGADKEALITIIQDILTAKIKK